LKYLRHFKWAKEAEKDIDPNELSIDNAYKTRWIWYHTILGILLSMNVLVGFAILVLLIVKL
jgi:hypothetical protein|tara:strand:- start:65 stop:250 length:186 start_codon:yes stop_codon:yes gene_type:complete